MNTKYTIDPCNQVAQAIQDGYSVPFFFEGLFLICELNQNQYPIADVQKTPMPDMESGHIVYRIEVDGIRGYAVAVIYDDE